MNRNLFFCLLGCLSFLIIGCGSSSNNNDGNNDIPGASAEDNGGALIISPEDGSSFNAGDSIHFQGECSETADDSLYEAYVGQWSVGGDPFNLIGVGTDITVNNLEIGTHTIVFTCVSADGSPATDEITLTVNKVESILRWPDTGQVTSYTDVFGEDSDYNFNPRSYTKLGLNGTELAENATNWIMVRDNVTGLIWEVKTDDNSIQDKDHLYNEESIHEVFLRQLNGGNFGGFNDWRLPTIKELSTLANLENDGPAIDTAYFPNTMPEIYISSTPAINAWVVDFYDGDIKYLLSTYEFYIRAVRSEN